MAPSCAAKSSKTGKMRSTTAPLRLSSIDRHICQLKKGLVCFLASSKYLGGSGILDGSRVSKRKQPPRDATGVSQLRR